MTFTEDIKNELYTIGCSKWSVTLANILEFLSFPTSLEYSCNKNEFLYEHLDRLNSISANDKKAFFDGDQVSEYRLEKKFNRIKMFGIKLSGNPKLRNERVYELYRVFIKIYGRYTILAVVFDNDICFTGVNINFQGQIEIIISEWFGFKDEDARLERLLEIDFSLFNDSSLTNLYNDYVEAISRDYIRYPESKVYQLYGLDSPITMDVLVKSPNGDEDILVTRVDREETLALRQEYIQKQYDWDYFVDDRNTEAEEDFDLNENDAEFEWTMLEMELADELAQEEELSEEDNLFKIFEEDNDYESDDLFDIFLDDKKDLTGLNPEEMLDLIHNS